MLEELRVGRESLLWHFFPFLFIFRFGYAAEPGEVRVQWCVWVSAAPSSWQNSSITVCRIPLAVAKGGPYPQSTLSTNEHLLNVGPHTPGHSLHGDPPSIVAA